jgi:hypothetical protein
MDAGSVRRKLVQGIGGKDKTMMDGYGMGYGWIWTILIVVLVGVAIAALLKYLRKRTSDGEQTWNIPSTA